MLHVLYNDVTLSIVCTFLFHCKLLDQVNELHIIVDSAESHELRYQTNTKNEYRTLSDQV